MSPEPSRRQNRSALPSPSKSPTPTIFQFGSGTVNGEPEAVIAAPFISHTYTSPLGAYRHSRSALPSPSKSPLFAFTPIFALTVVAPEILTVQAPVPVHPPPVQPVNAEFACGVAVSVTAVPIGKLAEQVPPQAMPAGLLVTVPSPA